ncbi:MAG: AMP-binding protein [Deltaproteobacteria bacterium]|nr:AMP-binding protein [Deltaproteobacteria bacterium]
MSIYDEKPWLKHYDEGLAPEIAVDRESSYVDLFNASVRANPAAPAVHFMGVTFTYGEVDDLSGRFAAYLSACGCSPGDVVGINLPNIPQYIIALVGSLRCGCAVTGVSPLLTAREMAYQINDADARVLVTLDAIFENRVQPVQGEVPGLQHIVCANIGDYLPPLKRFLGKLLKKIPGGKLAPLPGKEVTAFKQVMASHANQPPQVEISQADTCLVQYTGGTTGMPKGVELTHGNIVVNAAQIADWLSYRFGKEVMCSAFPLFHMAGLMVCMASLTQNTPQCLIPDPRNTKHICGEIKTYHPTVVVNVPSLYQMLMETPGFDALDFSSCKAFVSGAAPFAVESIQAFEAIVGSGKVLEVYGMTETSPIATMNPLKGKKKIGSVGLPVQSTRIKLVDIETGTTEVPVGEEGELIVNGPQVMKGYLNKPDETAHAIRDFQGEKWLYTGDVARMDENGYFSIADRVKDMLIVGGYKVFSREVEEKLYQHPAVEFCAIVGVPNEDRPGNEIVKAVIQAPKGAGGMESIKEDIIAYCKENMAPYKVPKIVEFVDEIPLTAVGKVDKKALR